MNRWTRWFIFTLLSGTSFAGAASSQTPVILKANAPEYNFQVLAGSQRQISVKLVGGIKKTVDWSIESVTGGATAKLDRGHNAIGVANVSFGPGSGKCSIRGGLGSYAVTSTASVTVTARSVDDPSQKATFLFNVCANTTAVEIVPAYQQAFRRQPVELQSWVVGNTDESGKWTITGRYTLLYTSTADPTKSRTAIVYVSPNTLPEYAATTSLTQPAECYPDPALQRTVFQVGPEFRYKNLRSVPTSTWKAGSIMRIHNMDTTGTKPTIYHESMRIMGDGTEAEPLIVCGVPDHAGNLPVVDGEGAQLPPWDGGGTQGYGVINIWGSGTYNGTYSDGSGGPEYVVLAGLAIAHAGAGFDYTSSENGRQNKYVNGASCVDVRSGTHILIEGIDMDQCSNGLFIANNSARNGFFTVTRFLDVLKTIGAVDTGEQPRLASIVIEGADDPVLEDLPPGPYYGVDPIRVMCVYSDGLSTDCADTATITSSNPAAAIIIAGNKILPDKPGSGMITATLSGVRSQPVHFSVK